MTKRKLTKQQTQRIRGNRLAQQSNSELPFSDQDLGAPQEGLVIARFGNQADVESVDGYIRRCLFRSHMGSPVAGDKVIWREGAEASVIESVLPRFSEMVRPDSFGNLKLVAANVDSMIITMALLPEPHTNLIDRYLVAAANLNLHAIILINKCDLINDENASLIANIDTLYQKLDYRVLHISAKSELGFDELRKTLVNRTSVFVGQSGVGKSSILQSLMPDETIKVGDLSEQIAKGRHTTTNAKLYHFPDGGNCIDSPGIREFGLWHLSPNDVMQGFPDLWEYAQNCKFRDCSHTEEPGCMLREAIESKKVEQQRYDSFFRIIRSLNEVQIKTRNRD